MLRYFLSVVIYVDCSKIGVRNLVYEYLEY